MGKVQNVVILNGKNFYGSYKTGEQFSSVGIITDSIFKDLNNEFLSES